MLVSKMPQSPPVSLRGFMRHGARLALLAVLSLHLAAFAQDKPANPASTTQSPPAAADQAMPFGRVYRISGEITVTRGSDQTGHPLGDGEITYVGDIIHAGPNAEAIIKTDDAGMIGIRPNTEFLAEHFSAKAESSDRMDLRLIRGSLRVISGWIGRLDRENYAIRTPAATIGVRGTDHEPYVLTAEQASGTPYKVGSYDKVNSGRTVIVTKGGELEIDAGHVGFARGSGTSQNTRGLLTLLLPVLLDKVPDFYTGGQFENELDSYSKSADATSTQQFNARKEFQAPVSAANCSPRTVARDWIARFDKAVLDQDVDAVVKLFAPDAVIQANVRESGGKVSSVTFTREELAASATRAVQDLQNYSQRRFTLDAVAMPNSTPGTCARIAIKSNVVEQGKQSGRPYRLEAREEYILEQQEGMWLAIRALTTQK